MTRSAADVVVVGAGVIGLSIAYQLARHRAGRITVFEKGAAVAEGSTGASSAVLRQRYSHAAMIQLARDGLRAYSRWADFTGLAVPRAEFQHAGVLWMTGESAADVAADRKRLNDLGVAAMLLDADELRERFPALSACGASLDLSGEHEHRCTEGGPYLLELDGGYTDPVGAAHDLLEASRRDGVDVRLRESVTGIRAAGGRVRGVDLASGGGVDAPVVINAAGPWCNRLTALTGVQIPWTLRPTRVQVLYRDWPPELPGPLPVVGDLASGIYFRPESRGQQLLVGSTRPQDEREQVEDPDDFDRGLDPAFRQGRIHGLHHRLPRLPHRGRVTGLAGLYTVNEEDVHPVIGPTELEGYLVANGFSGHGFKLAPMVGSMVARWLTGQRVDFDTEVPLGFFAVDRAPLALREKSVLA
ncbi:MAG: FAD-dependent oxidoreductase [Myxococcota bacterium]